MGAFEKLFKKPKQVTKVNSYFKMLDGYTPIFSTWDGGVFEMELTRACIDAFARHSSKLQPNIEGADRYGLKAILNTKPNPFMTSAQFLYKCAAFYDAKNTCFITPILDKFDRLVGYYPVDPSQVEVIDVGGEPWLRYHFRSGEIAAVELARCGVVSKHLYSNDIKGDSNDALRPTMQLLAMQNQGISEGIKNSAAIRFMATLGNFTKREDMLKQRKDWVEDNLGPEAGGLAVFPNTFTNVQQIQSAAKVVDAEQVKLIENRVYNYFGSNEDILQNKAFGDKWSAYYEGKIEPVSIQLGQALTYMSFTQNERTRGNAITWSSNRLQYMTNVEKLNVSSQMFDRGILSTNDVMDIWNLPHVPDGDKRYIRKEYTEVSQLDKVAQLQKELEAAQNKNNATKQPTEKEEKDDPRQQD